MADFFPLLISKPLVRKTSSSSAAVGRAAPWPLTLGAGVEGVQARLYLYGPLPLNNANPPQKDFSSLEILLERQVNFNGENPWL